MVLGFVDAKQRKVRALGGTGFQPAAKAWENLWSDGGFPDGQYPQDETLGYQLQKSINNRSDSSFFDPDTKPHDSWVDHLRTAEVCP